jgi:2-dehydro-3-deoxyphosphogluconate aldolase / (4S)-4-hydroxy-2-oxoglutarate aldolase
MARGDVTAAIERHGIVAVIRMKDPGGLRAVIDALADGGVRAFEVTMTVPRAIEMIEQIAASLPDGLMLGAGTVLDAETASRVIDAGASFIVSPVFRPAIIETCHRRDVPAMPGCFTPTEILEAWDAGADVVKVFPATSLGPQFLRDVRAPLPQLRLMPTGGVSLDNAGDWIRAGAVAVGIGSALVDAKAAESGDFAVITRNAARVAAGVRAAREARA